MSINRNEAHFLATELKDCGASIAFASLRAGNPFWRTMVDAGWLQEVVRIGRQEALAQTVFDLEESASSTDAVEFVKALRESFGSDEFGALLRGDPSPSVAWSAPMAWIQGVGRSKSAEAATYKAGIVCALLTEVADVPQLFEVQRKGQFIVSMQRVGANSQKLDFTHSALSLAIAGDLSMDTPEVSPPGDDAYASARLVKQLMACGVQPDLPSAKLLFKVLRESEARSWMSWIAAQDGGIGFSQAMIKRAARIRPDTELVAQFQAMMAQAVVRGVSRSLQPSHVP